MHSFSRPFYRDIYLSPAPPFPLSPPIALTTYSSTQSKENAGYRTARVGKYHLAPDKVYHFQKVFNANKRNPVKMAQVCNDFIKKKKAPFFLYFCTSDPHRDGKNQNIPYSPNSFGNRKDGFYPGVIEQHYDPKDVIVPVFLPDTPESRAELAQYYQSVSRADQGVKHLMKICSFLTISFPQS